MSIAAAAGIGYLTSFLAFCAGGIIMIAMGRFHLDKRLHGTILGFTAGLLISFVCFKMLPDVFSRFGLYKCIFFIVLGVIFSALMESRLEKADSSALALSVAFGVSVHNIPEGMAVGSLLNYSLESGLGLALVIALHCLPESLAVYIPFKSSEKLSSRMWMLPFIMPIPMGLGALLGALSGALGDASSGNALIADACLGLAAGVMIYVACGEIIPESKDIWHGRLSSLGAMLGFIVGILLTSRV